MPPARTPHDRAHTHMTVRVKACDGASAQARDELALHTRAMARTIARDVDQAHALVHITLHGPLRMPIEFQR